MAISFVLFCLTLVVGLFLTLFKNPKYGLYTYLLVFYGFPPARWWGQSYTGIRWSLIVSILTLIAMIIHRSTVSKRNWLSYFPAKMLVTYAIWMSIQFIWIIHVETQTEGFILLIKYIILYYMIYKLLNTEKDIIQFIMAHILGCFYFGILAKEGAGAGRLEGIGNPGVHDANTFGMHQATGLMMASIFLLYSNRKIVVVSLLSVPYILNAVVLTQSRGVFLSIVMGALALVRIKPKATKKKFYALGILGLFLFGLLANDLFWNRMTTISASARNDDSYDDNRGDVASGRSRFYIIGKQWEMFKDHPLGAGHRGTNKLSPQYMPSILTKGARSSHNTLMAFLVNQGIVGIFIYLALIVWVIITIEKLRKSTEYGKNVSKSIILTSIGGGFTVLFIAGLFSNFLKAEVGIWLLGLLAALQELEKETIKK